MAAKNYWDQIRREWKIEWLYIAAKLRLTPEETARGWKFIFDEEL